MTSYQFIDDWTIELFGKQFRISEEHTGRYVFLKSVWEDANLPPEVQALADPWEWEDYDWLEPDGKEYVVLDFGGQLEGQDPDTGYYYAIDEEGCLPELPWDGLNWDLCDVGNG